jgi:hypothetical protein
LTSDIERKEQWIRDTKAEEDRIREIKNTKDWNRWRGLETLIDNKLLELIKLKDNIGNMKLYEIAELKKKQDMLEQKIMKDYNITHYTKYGLFRSRRYDNIF